MTDFFSFCETAQKYSYPTVEAARRSLAGQLRSKRIRSYPCDACHMIHITKEPVRRAERFKYTKPYKRGEKHKNTYRQITPD